VHCEGEYVGIATHRKMKNDQDGDDDFGETEHFASSSTSSLC